ncbi:MBL fold metallo-hydrolase [Flavisolibacter sp. BT320]|nr:MBL fold metallo-hydrolase [Flavisolibacter longurius]
MDVHILALPYGINDKQDVLYPVLLQYRDERILVDCGYEETVPELEKSLAAVGASISQLTGLVLTHHDIDHIAGAYRIRQNHPSLLVYASAIEAKYISGQAKSLRLQQAEDIYQCLPEDQKPGAKVFQAFLETVKPVPVDEILDKNSQWSMAGEVAIIPTPGHTPGHISLYLKQQRTLIAGDAVVIEEGSLNLANPRYALDLPAAISSVSKLQKLPIDKLICYHGGVYSGNVQEALHTLIQKWQNSN